METPHKGISLEFSSGVFPDSGEDDQNHSSADTATPARESDSRSDTSLAEGLDQMNLGSGPDTKASLDGITARIRESVSYKTTFSERAAKDLTPDGFDEAKFTDGYFSAFEIDIADEDQGFGIFENEDSDDADTDSDENLSP